MTGPGEVFAVALRLGCTSFGGPIAHLGYFRAEYVHRRAWLSDPAYAELVALAQFLPGPTSSQVGMAIGYQRAGARGAAAAWAGFTLPSALALAAAAGLAGATHLAGAAWVHALQLVAVAVVLDAVIAMARSLARTARTAAIAVTVAACLLLAPTAGWLQLVALALAGLIGAALLPPPAAADTPELPLHVPRRAGKACLAVLVGMLVGLLVAAPLLARYGPLLQLAAAMYRSGALVFGGGHVVLPLLQEQTVPQLVPADQFLAGYGLAQAVPGPLFTFASYLGQVSAGVAGALVATVAIFAPGALALFAVLPYWHQVRARRRVRAALAGVNAGVVGLLAAAWIRPVVTDTVATIVDAGYAAALFALLRRVGWPPWAVVGVALAASPLLGALRADG